MHIIKELSIQPSQKTVHPQDYVQRSYLPYILTHLLDISWKLTGNVWQGIGWTSVMVFQIIGKSFVHSTACLGLKQRKQRRPTKDQQCGKHFDAMTSIWHVMPSLNKLNYVTFRHALKPQQSHEGHFATLFSQTFEVYQAKSYPAWSNVMDSYSCLNGAYGEALMFLRSQWALMYFPLTSVRWGFCNNLNV